MKYHCIPVRTAKIKNNANVEEDIEKLDPAGNIKWYIGSFLYITKHAATIPSKYILEELKIYVDIKTHKFIGSLFIVRNWKQPKYPPLGEQLSKLWCIHTKEY